MTLLHFNGNVLFEKKNHGLLIRGKTNNQDLFVVILMLICAWQTSILLCSLTARKLIFLCLL